MPAASTLLLAALLTLPLPPWPQGLTWDQGIAAQWLRLSSLLAPFSPALASSLTLRAAQAFTGPRHLTLKRLALSQLLASGQDTGEVAAALPAAPPKAIPLPLLGAQWLVQRQKHAPELWLAKALPLPGAPEVLCPVILPLSMTHSQAQWPARLLQMDPEDRAFHTTLFALIHAHCTDSLTPTMAHTLGLPLSNALRLTRADRLLGQVRFGETLEELRAVTVPTPTEACAQHFLQAKATYRIRKQRRQTPGLYEKALAACEQAGDRERHKKSLYGLATFHFDARKPDLAAPLFRRLATAYAHTSYADDAALFEARILRGRGDQEAADTLVRQTLERLPQGDMVHEMAWEALERHVYAKDWEGYLKALETFDLPSRDDTYFSQGRLLFFKALAHRHVRQPQLATAALRQLWHTYPFSFYGAQAKALLPDPGQPGTGDLGAPWDPFATASWAKSDAALLAWAGYAHLGARLEAQATTTPTEEDLWRLALLYHLGGQYHISHNIVRRRISGRPWAAQGKGQGAKWRIAWPDPFAPMIQDALAKEAVQHPNVPLEPALIRAIMREESSFIPEIESYAGALGLMQLMLPTARDHDDDLPHPVTPAQLKTPAINIRVAIDHLFLLAARMESDPAFMAASYNAGAGAVRRWRRTYPPAPQALWVESIPTYQARNYTKRVLGSMTAYRWLLDQQQEEKKRERAKETSP